MSGESSKEKTGYRIPIKINTSILDVHIHLFDMLSRNIKLGTILSLILSGCVLYMVMTYSWMSKAGLMWSAIFIVGWIYMTFLLMMPDKTGVTKYRLVPVLWRYIQGTNRKVYTRATSNAEAFKRLVGVEDIDPDVGKITFTDGSCAFMYKVIGNASLLLFSSDIQQIMNTVDRFYRLLEEDTVDLTWITMKSPQKVTEQILHLREQQRNLEDPTLQALVEQDISMLETQVGRNFYSIHQYLVVRTNDQETLMKVQARIRDFTTNYKHVFKKVQCLLDDDIYEVFRSVYQDRNLMM